MKSLFEFIKGNKSKEEGKKKMAEQENDESWQTLQAEGTSSIDVN